MEQLLEKSLRVQGGIEPWDQLQSLSAKFTYGGALLQMKGHAQSLKETRIDLDVMNNTLEYFSSLESDSEAHISFSPERVAIRLDNGVIKERSNPRDSFKGHSSETKWDELHLAYFVGCSVRTALLSPFLLARGKSILETGGTYKDDGRVFNKLRAQFQRTDAPFSVEQTYYFNAQTSFLARIDYQFELCGNTLVSHEFSDYRLNDGLLLPLKHRILVRKENGEVLPQPVVVSIDIKDLKLNFQTERKVK